MLWQRGGAVQSTLSLLLRILALARQLSASPVTAAACCRFVCKHQLFESHTSVSSAMTLLWNSHVETWLRLDNRTPADLISADHLSLQQIEMLWAPGTGRRPGRRQRTSWRDYEPFSIRVRVETFFCPCETSSSAAQVLFTRNSPWSVLETPRLPRMHLLVCPWQRKYLRIHFGFQAKDGKLLSNFENFWMLSHLLLHYFLCKKSTV